MRLLSRDAHRRVTFGRHTRRHATRKPLVVAATAGSLDSADPYYSDKATHLELSFQDEAGRTPTAGLVCESGRRTVAEPRPSRRILDCSPMRTLSPHPHHEVRV
jgi:hypothetical protein